MTLAPTEEALRGENPPPDLPVLPVPAELGLSTMAPLVAASVGSRAVLLLGRDAKLGWPVLAVVDDGRAERLWQTTSRKKAPTDVQTAPPGEIATLPDGTGIALIASGPFFAIHADTLHPHLVTVPRPDTLISGRTGAGTVAMAHRHKAGHWLIHDILSVAEITARRSSYRAFPKRQAPELTASQRPSLYHVSPTFGRLLGANDPVRGFALWREADDGTWTNLAGNGFFRFGLNAALLAALPWQDRLILTAGADSDLYRDTPRLPVSDELLAIDKAGCCLLCGDLRLGQKHLVRPELGSGHPLMRARQGAALQILGVATQGDSLLVLVHDRLFDRRRIFALASGGSGHWLPVSGSPRALVQTGQGAMAVVIPD